MLFPRRRSRAHPTSARRTRSRPTRAATAIAALLYQARPHRHCAWLFRRWSGGVARDPAPRDRLRAAASSRRRYRIRRAIPPTRRSAASSKTFHGFGELFRTLSFHDIGPGRMSRAPPPVSPAAPPSCAAGLKCRRLAMERPILRSSATSSASCVSGRVYIATRSLPPSPSPRRSHRHRCRAAHRADGALPLRPTAVSSLATCGRPAMCRRSIARRWMATP